MGPKVPKGQSLSEAEKRALSGDVESQDSQLFLQRYYQKYAPGLRSSSPSQPLPPEAVRDQLQQYTKSTKVHQRFAGTPTSAPAPKANTKTKADPRWGRSAKSKPTKDKDERHAAGAISKRAAEPSRGARAKAAPNTSAFHNQRASSAQSTSHNSGRSTLSETVEEPESEPELDANLEPQEIGETHIRNDLCASVGTVNPASLNLALSNDDDGGNNRSLRPPTQQVSGNSTTRKKSKSGLAKMEISQSPTQSNNGRSYEQYLPRGDDLIPTEPPEQLEPVSQHSEHPSNSQDENRSLHEDDTGAINFDNIDRYDTGTDFTAPDSVGAGIPAHESPSQMVGYPETPAPPRNPFAGNKAFLLGGSQLFKHTQISSACKAFSPTWSRPSPDNFQQQDLFSPNDVISSPLKNFVRSSPSHGAISSPQLPPPYDTSPQQDRYEQPISDEVVTISTLFRPTHKNQTGLMESYKPMHKSEDKSNLSPLLDVETDSDDNADYDDVERRRRLAMFRKMAADEQLRSINIERQSVIKDVVVPSTNRRTGKPHKAESERYLAQCEEEVGDGSQDAVEDSQDAIVHSASRQIDTQQAVIGDSQAGNLLISLEHEGVVSSDVGVVADTLPNTARTPSRSTVASEEDSAPMPENKSNRPKQGDSDAIPETSPARLRPLGEMLHLSDEASKPVSFSNLLESSSRDNSLDRTGDRIICLSPDIQSSPSLQARRPPRRGQRKHRESPDTSISQNRADNTLPGKDAEPEMVVEAEKRLAISSSPPPQAVSTRSGLRGKRCHGQSMSPEGPSSSVSTLSVLSTTPEVSNKTTPLTQESPANTNNITPLRNAPQTSPAAAKANRRGSIGAATKSNHVAPKKNLRTSARRSGRSSARQASVSMDELTKPLSSSSPRTFEQSAILSRLGRTSLRDTPGSRETSRGGGAKILTGMAFAISFQSKKPNEKDKHYNSRLSHSEKIADTIKQAGGKVLASGFDELFEFTTIKHAEVGSSTPPPDDEIKLTTAARNTGFTALIADGHSRKVKYMQALALGLPCIHERWITTSVEKQELVDWSDYLLCAGNSMFLGEAIRSRNLPSYDVASAKLSEVIEHRPQLLRGSRILLVLRKKDESQKMAYVFLARVLGASLSRVYSMDEARGQLKATEDAGYPYDWVYVEDTMAAKADLFASSTDSPFSTSTTGTKKRKRKGDVELAGAPLKKIRTLSNELVIQSLILGRLLTEGEIYV